MSKVQWVATGSATDPCCCEEEPGCCMYPADGLGDDYEAADLPDDVIVTYDMEDGVTYERQAGGYYQNPEGTLFLVAYNEPTSGWNWCYCSTSSPTGDQDPISPCLITGDGNLTPGDDAVEDQFEDTYAVGNTGVTVTRESLCYWISDNQAWLYFNSNDQRWEVNVFEQGIGQPDDSESGGIYTKDGTQDSPVGGYSKDGYTLTVS
jgi:hypothetical protein